MRWLLFFVLLSSFVLAQPIEYCDGCSYDGRCINFNSQVKSPSGFLYCALDSNLYPAKLESVPCSANYECLSFFCSGGVCQPSAAEPLVINLHSSFFLPTIIFGIIFFVALLFFLIKFSLKSKTLKAESVKKAKPSVKETTIPSIRIMPIRRKYSPFEKLEEQIEETTKKLVRK